MTSVAEYRGVLDQIIDAMRYLVRAVLVGQGIPATGSQRQDVAISLVRQVRESRQLTHVAASRYLYQHGVTPALLQPAPYRLEAVTKTLERVVDLDSPAKTQDGLQKALQRHAEQPARQLVRTTAAVEDGAWARVLTGPTSCAFCAMLASRGPVFETKAKVFDHGPGKTMFEGVEIDAYHDGCDCVVVFVPRGSRDWEGHSEWRKLRKAWKDSDYDGALRDPEDNRPPKLVFRSWWEQQVRQSKGEQVIAPTQRATKSAGTKAVAPESKADIAARLLPGLEKSLADLRAKGLTEDNAKIVYHKEQIARRKADLGGVEASAAKGQSGPRKRPVSNRPPEARRPEPQGGLGGGGSIPPNRFLPGGMDIPEEYPPLPDGSRVPFSPREAPLPTRGDLRRVLRKHRHDSKVSNKTRFPVSWSDADVEAAIELTIRAPDAGMVDRLGDKIVFERIVDGVLVRVYVRDDLIPPRFWSAFTKYE